jgi:RNA polymerase sigma factor (sigma-70 family)
VDSAVEFQGLVLGHLDSLYNYALVLTRRTEDAEDLLQEVLVRGFQSFATYDRSLSFKGWMFTIIKNTYIDRFRRQRRLPFGFDRDPVAAHHVEHLAFFGAAVLFWWPVIGPAPRARRPASYGLRIAHVVIAALHGSVLAMLLAWSPRVLYDTYAAAPRVTTLTPLEDQALGGVIMWAGSSTVDMLAVLALVWRLLAALERPAGAAPAELGAK